MDQSRVNQGGVGVQSTTTQVVDLIHQYKQDIRNVLGSPPTGTSFEMKTSFSPDDVKRLEDRLGITHEQADLICQFWPIYQLGYGDGVEQSPSSGRL